MSCYACGKSGEAAAYCSSTHCPRNGHYSALNNYNYTPSHRSGGGGGSFGGGSNDADPILALFAHLSAYAGLISTVWLIVHPESFLKQLAKLAINATVVAGACAAVYGTYRGIKYKLDRNSDSRYNGIKAKLLTTSLL